MDSANRSIECHDCRLMWLNLSCDTSLNAASSNFSMTGGNWHLNHMAVFKLSLDVNNALAQISCDLWSLYSQDGLFSAAIDLNRESASPYLPFWTIRILGTHFFALRILNATIRLCPSRSYATLLVRSNHTGTLLDLSSTCYGPMSNEGQQPLTYRNLQTSWTPHGYHKNGVF